MWRTMQHVRAESGHGAELRRSRKNWTRMPELALEAHFRLARAHSGQGGLAGQRARALALLVRGSRHSSPARVAEAPRASTRATGRVEVPCITPTALFAAPCASLARAHIASGRFCRRFGMRLVLYARLSNHLATPFVALFHPGTGGVR